MCPPLVVTTAQGPWKNSSASRSPHRPRSLRAWDLCRVEGPIDLGDVFERGLLNHCHEHRAGMRRARTITSRWRCRPSCARNCLWKPASGGGDYASSSFFAQAASDATVVLASEAKRKHDQSVSAPSVNRRGRQPTRTAAAPRCDHLAAYDKQRAASRCLRSTTLGAPPSSRASQPLLASRACNALSQACPTIERS